MYDAKAFDRLALKLDSRATQIVFGYGLLGLVLGIAVAAIFHSNVLVLAIVGIVVGTVAGEQRAFELRVRAQTIFCLIALETNTRQSVGRMDR